MAGVQGHSLMGTVSISQSEFRSVLGSLGSPSRFNDMSSLFEGLANRCRHGDVATASRMELGN